MHLIKLLTEYNIVKYGKFTLKSGQTSNIYFNCKGIYEYPQLMTDICYELSKFIKNDKVGIAGVPMGGIPFATLVSYMKKLPLVLIREEKKDYGMMQQVENDHYDEYYIIEDVITTGKSVIDTIKILNKKVHVICIMDREAGGVNRLRELGHQVDCLFTLSNFYVSSLPKVLNVNNVIDKLLRIRDTKGSKLVASLDCENLYEVMEIVGPHVCAVKIHGDIFESLDVNKLNELKEKFNFLIIEDRKFSDIPYICLKQLKLIKKYADIVTVHGICGEMLIKSISNEVGVLIVHTMSLKDNLIDRVYQNKVLDMKCDNLVGYVSQEKIEGYLTFTPGIHLNIKEDGLYQQYKLPQNSDFYIVGRGIYEGDILSNILMYKNY